VKFYPLFMDLAGRECLVVGAGAVAARKARSLLECGAAVTVVGERPAAAFRTLERRGVRLVRRRFRAGDVSRQALVIAATDDRAVNAAVSAAARRRGIPVNAVDDPPNCTFIVPAVVRRGDLTVAVSTGGKSPAAARLVKERIAAMLGDEHAALVRLLGAHRERMKETVPSQARRAQAWNRMLNEGIIDSLRMGSGREALATLRRCVADAAGSNRDIGVIALSSSGRRGDAERGTPGGRTEGSTMRKCLPGSDGMRSDRGPNETASTRGVAVQTAAGRAVESEGVRSGRTPKPARAARKLSRR
jgi:siroheme synthase-like protein